MKICHAVYSLEMGGAEVLVAQLCRLQRERGHQVSICAYSRLGALGEQLRDEGFEIYVPGEAHPARTALRYLGRFRRDRPDVVHCHNPAPTLQAAWSARLAGVRRVLVTRHSLVAPPYDTAGEVKFGVCSLACDWIVGVCEITCNNLRGAPLAHRSRIVRVYNGVGELPPAETGPREEGGLRLIFVGRLAEIKDLPTLLRAVALAAPRVPGLQLTLVGDGPVRGELEGLAQELGIAHQVYFAGQQMQTAPFFRAADLFVMSSVSEGVPMSLLQAMSIGLPALLTDVGGMQEVLRLTEAGLLSPVGDAAAMAAAIVRLAADPGLRAELSQRARAAYLQHFTLERTYDGYMSLYAG